MGREEKKDMDDMWMYQSITFLGAVKNGIFWSWLEQDKKKNTKSTMICSLIEDNAMF